MPKPIIAITMGDPGGIGPEIILKTLQNTSSKKAIYLVIGCDEVFQYALERSQIHFRFNVIPTLEASFLDDTQINFLDITREAEALYEKTFGEKRPEDEVFSVGKVSKWNGALAYTALKVAAYQAAYGLVQGIVTAPIQKRAIQLMDPKFLGHTEYLAKVAKTKEFAMMFTSPKLRVTLVTIHVPLKKVSSMLTEEEIVVKISLTHEFLKEHLKIKNPRIGVAALNPHGSEFGEEEEKIISPAVQAAQKKGIKAEGPFSGDEIFHQAYEGELDAVIAMYHDEGLAPFKMIAFHEGVNVTLGLPYMRTSPDHGTAYDIAYQNKANPSAFQSALKLLENLL